MMPITRLLFTHFTAFKQLDMKLSPGINVLIGANGTGKTHIMKFAYAACAISASESTTNFADKLVRVYLPSGRALGRLVKHGQRNAQGSAEIHRDDLKLHISFSRSAKTPDSATVTGEEEWRSKPIESVYIPVKEMLANAPGFRALYARREIHFEEIYADILDRAYLPELRDKEESIETLLKKLQQLIGGQVTEKGGEFFIRYKQGELEFTLLAEGLRKLGLLWLLIQNGTLANGSVLFWDEPETNLNPKLFGPVIEILLELQRMGVQIFLATHDYVILKEIDLRMTKNDNILFHSLYRDKSTGEIMCHSVSDYLAIHPNVILEAFTNLYDRTIKQVLKGKTHGDSSGG
jgi:predicted ATP-dependent endonuclease of OLD family